MNFKDWLINEEIDVYDDLTPEKYLEMLKNSPKIWEQIKRDSKSGAMLIQLLDTDFFNLYGQAQSRKIDPKSISHYIEVFNNKIMPFLRELISQGYLRKDSESVSASGFIHPQISINNPHLNKILPPELLQPGTDKKEIGKWLINDHPNGNDDSDKKIYYSFDHGSPNLEQGMNSLIKYFAEHPEYFRQSKFPVDPARSESFIFYLSNNGEKFIPQIDSDVKKILSKLNLSSKSWVKSDMGQYSGNQLDYAKLNLQAILPLLNCEQLQNYTTSLEKGMKLGNSITSKLAKAENKWKIFTSGNLPSSQYEIIKRDPKLIALFDKCNIKFDVESPESAYKRIFDKDHPNAKPTINQNNGNLTLIPQETNKPLPLKFNITVGKLLINTPNALRFMSEKQFVINKNKDGLWTITHHPEATNKTNLNDKQLGLNPEILNNGDIISLGKTKQVPIKVTFS